MKIVKKKQPKFNPELVEINEPVVGDILEAQRLAGDNPSDVDQSLAILSRIVVIDGKRLSFEEWQNLPFGFFSELSGELDAEVFGVSEEQLSNLLASASNSKKLK